MCITDVPRIQVTCSYTCTGAGIRRPEYEVFALFDALAELDVAAAVCQRLCAWIKAQQADLFVPL